MIPVLLLIFTILFLLYRRRRTVFVRFQDHPVPRRLLNRTFMSPLLSSIVMTA